MRRIKRWLKRKRAAVLAAALLAALALAAGCGQRTGAYAPAASFAAAETAAAVDSAAAAGPGAAQQAASAGGLQPTAPERAAGAGGAAPAEGAQPSAPERAAGAEGAASAEGAQPSVSERAAGAGGAAPAEGAQPSALERAAGAGGAAPAEGTQPTAPAAPPAAVHRASNELLWSEFFDDDKQSTPSEKFWDLNGKTVQIRGFMGEVLSFDKHWFLLIPQPGAECPFDNGDETYWNKIMIVYVPKDVKLRYTQGPLQITGRLDVGIKIDESGYKTMFRLYDAKFERLTE